MIRTIFICLICLLFAGCDFAVHNYELEGYAAACADKGGIARVDNVLSAATCGNGELVTWHSK